MKRIGRYEVVRELRAGGMGTVTLGKSPDGQLVVLKRPHSLDPDAAVRLRDEARIGARLLHPSIVDTLDLFDLDTGVPVLVVAYVDGPSLEVLRPLGPLPPGVVARIGRQIAEGLAALHAADDEHGKPLHILHRDVTPGNIVVGKDGEARLIDLGIARFSERQAEHTQDGFLRGTMRYLAPELLQGDTYTAASDLWALGMVLWEAAIGRFAYRGETDREVLAGILRGEPMELDEGETIDEELARAIRPLLQLNPLQRVRSGTEAAENFAAVEEQHGDTATLTRASITDALARKIERDASHKARLAEMLKPENLGFPSPVRGHVLGDELFPDEATAAEVEQYDGASAYDLPHSSPFDPSVETAAEEVDEDPTLPLKGIAKGTPGPRAPRDDGGYGFAENTVNVPAPVSFLVPPESFHEDEAEDALDATTPLPTLHIPDDALRSDAERSQDGRSQGAAHHPPVSFDAEDTASVSDPRVPKSALRSDAPDLPERAAEFDAGDLLPWPEPPAFAMPEVEDDDEPTLVSATPVLPPERSPPRFEPAAVATAGPTPELDDDEIGEMHTMDGLSPVRLPTPLPPPRALGRIGLVRKTAAQIAEEREAKSRPQKPSIDDLPPARPKPREEEPAQHADGAPPLPPRSPRAEQIDDDVRPLSPFSLEQARDRLLAKQDDDSDNATPKAGKKAAAKKQKRKKKRAEEEPAVEVEEPSSTRFLDERVIREQLERLVEQTQVSPPADDEDPPSSTFGVRIVELPPPAPPVLPSSTFAPALAAARAAAAAAAEAPEGAAEPEPPREPPRERAAGEVMKLKDVAAFLDDD